MMNALQLNLIRGTVTDKRLRRILILIALLLFSPICASTLYADPLYVCSNKTYTNRYREQDDCKAINHVQPCSYGQQRVFLAGRNGGSSCQNANQVARSYEEARKRKTLTENDQHFKPQNDDQRLSRMTESSKRQSFLPLQDNSQDRQESSCWKELRQGIIDGPNCDLPSALIELKRLFGI